MEKMMLGNEAIARGLYEAGCRFVSSYPGTPSTEITEYAARYSTVYAEWAANEKVGLESAVGACLAGARAACAMKHVGLNVCADTLFTVSYIGVNGGLVLVVADDPGMHSSQNEQDSRHFARAAKVPMLEPSDAAECRAFTKLAFGLSEEYDTPVLVRSCTRVAHSQCPVPMEEPSDIEIKEYSAQPRKRVAVPGNARARHEVVESRCRSLEALAETMSINEVTYADRSIGFVASGTCALYVREAFPNASLFKLGMVYPLPVEALRTFSENVEKLIVVEELDGFIETHLRASGIRVDGGKNLFGYTGEINAKRIRQALNAQTYAHATVAEAIPQRPPVMCPGCPHRGLFTVLRKLNLHVLGDVGCYTLAASAPLSAMDVQICMGASIGMAHGFSKVRPDEASRTVAVIGDSTFVHGGMTALISAVYNKSTFTTIILDNAITGMTGHQQNPTTGITLKQEETKHILLEDVCRGLGVERVRVVDPDDMNATEQVLLEELSAPEPSVIIARRPCVLLKSVKPQAPMRVIADKCVGCKSCMVMGCPALGFDGQKAHIDETLCAGCSLCTQICPCNAFVRTGGEDA